jgi:hypothetical protein
MGRKSKARLRLEALCKANAAKARKTATIAALQDLSDTLDLIITDRELPAHASLSVRWN